MFFDKMKKPCIFGLRVNNNDNVSEGPNPSWKEKPGRRKGESPQLFSGIAHCGTRNDLPFFYSLYMRVPKSEGKSTKRSNGLATSTARHAAIDKIISRHFQTWGLTGTIEPIQRLQDFYITYAFERGIKPVFVADVAFKAALITKLICGLYENREGGKNG